MKDLSLHLLDILQNSIHAAASKIVLAIEAFDNQLKFTISDNGKGMDDEFLSKVTDPFVTTRTTRKVGLGIPLLKATVEMAEGELDITSARGAGTVLKASLRIDHIDRLPMGNLAETVVCTILAKPEIEFEVILKSINGEFEFNSAEVAGKLGDVPITGYEVLDWIKDYIEDGTKFIFGGVLDEIIS